MASRPCNCTEADSSYWGEDSGYNYLNFASCEGVPSIISHTVPSNPVECFAPSKPSLPTKLITTTQTTTAAVWNASHHRNPACQPILICIVILVGIAVVGRFGSLVRDQQPHLDRQGIELV